MQSIRIIGPGRAGTSLAAALVGARLGRRRLPRPPRRPDRRRRRGGRPGHRHARRRRGRPWPPPCAPRRETTVVHLSGSLGLDVLAPHPRRAALHPLVPLPNAVVGAARLASGVTFAVSGEPVARRMALSLGGRVVEVADDDRAAYHAAACIAANHVVALLGQVERVAALGRPRPRGLPAPDQGRGRRRGRARAAAGR